MGLLDGTTQAGYYDDSSSYSNYQFTSLDNIINQFIVAYIGEDKIIPRAKRLDVAFHAQRALQELSFDTFKSCKAQEVTVPANLQMILPRDYVNYTKVSWVDSAGIKHPIYPTSRTSNPSDNFLQSSLEGDGSFTLQATGTYSVGTSATGYIALDGEYKNIVVGMKVSAASIDSGSVVWDVSNSGGITSIRIARSLLPLTATSSYTFTSTDTETFTFSNSYDSLIATQDSCVIVENITYTIGASSSSALPEDRWKLTQSPNTNASSVKVGMFVSNQDWPAGTVVVDVNGAEIIVSNPPSTSILPSTNTEFTFYSLADSDTWSNYKSTTPSENNNDDYEDDTYWPLDGNRYGLDPQHAQANGSFYIDCKSGKIHFSSNISGKTVILDYISDSLGTDDEMQVHKFAEEAMYKWIAHAILASKANVPEYQVNRFKKERFAAIRTAKLRLSNIKLEEITQVLRGKSKQIKH